MNEAEPQEPVSSLAVSDIENALGSNRQGRRPPAGSKDKAGVVRHVDLSPPFLQVEKVVHIYISNRLIFLRVLELICIPTLNNTIVKGRRCGLPRLFEIDALAADRSPHSKES